MASLLKSLSLFKKTREQPPLASGSGGAIRGIKHVIIVLIPGDSSIVTRSRLLDRLVRMVGDPEVSGPKLTGVLISILSLFVESPGQLIQRIIDDPDISIKLVEVIPSINSTCGLTFASRGASLDAEADDFFGTMDKGSKDHNQMGWLENKDIIDIEVNDAEQFNILLASILAQIWILLAKAVTAPDTAADSEMRRWIKYTQQRRVIGEFRMNKIWLDIVRNRIAEDLSLRRFMVALILDIKRSPGNKPRIAEMICDIDNYIVEAGLASFILTIKFGIETMYPALGLHEFSGELTTIESLMVLYQQMGETAPYMVILENSVQNKFSAGSYPLLWSYAMGVGVELENSMGGLNFGRSYFDPAYFRLGQEMVRRSAGKVSSTFAAEFGITKEEAQLVSEIVSRTTEDRTTRATGPKQSQITFLHSERNEAPNQRLPPITMKSEFQGGDKYSNQLIDDRLSGYTSDVQSSEWDESRQITQLTQEGDHDNDQQSMEALAKMRQLTKILNQSDTNGEVSPAYNDRDLLS
uniref:Nucleocapsid n=1 Tax=Phocine distemper virus TaxID=11240 RepID=A0A4P9IX15_PHODV|nr:nucleocapsid protein [Phocine morbillivirus]